MHDGDAHLETVHLVGNMPVSAPAPSQRPAKVSCPRGLLCGMAVTSTATMHGTHAPHVPLGATEDAVSEAVHVALHSFTQLCRGPLCMWLLQSSSGREGDAEEGKAGAKAGEASMTGEAGPGAAQVSFLTAALMGVALCFHSILEVCHQQHPFLAAVLLS